MKWGEHKPGILFSRTILTSLCMIYDDDRDGDGYDNDLYKTARF
jgi:hypothetical protein